MKLDDKGRCCGHKPIFYKGGSWCSPLGSPKYFCTRCARDFGPDGEQRENFAWVKNNAGDFVAVGTAHAVAREFAQSNPGGKR